MFAHDDPFWFVSSDLLATVFHAELHGLAQLLAKHPNLHALLDAPEATVQERSACFTFLSHREVVRMIDQKFVARYEESPSMDATESSALKRAFGIVPADAPMWVLEMHQVVEQLPVHVCDSLPEALRIGHYPHDNPKQMQVVESAAQALSNVEQIQALTDTVINQQLLRLARRWSASIPPPIQVIQHANTAETFGKQKRRLNKRKGWKNKLKLYNAIQKTLRRDPSLKGIEFCAELDKRHAPPLYDWFKSEEWRGGLTWKEAWLDPALRRKIRRVRQDAQKFSE